MVTKEKPEERTLEKTLDKQRHNFLSGLFCSIASVFFYSLSEIGM